MNQDDPSVMQDWFLLLALNCLGSFIWICAGAIPLVVFGDHDNIWTGVAWFASMGLTGGLAQWLVIRWRIRQAGWWILATAAGWPVGLWIGIGLANRVGFISRPTTMVAAALGALLGLFQWFVLHGKTQHAWYWVAAAPIIWGLSGFIGDQATSLANGSSVTFATSSSGLGLLIAWALAEGASGLLLAWLLHKPVLSAIDPRRLQPQTQAP